MSFNCNGESNEKNIFKKIKKERSFSDNRKKKKNTPPTAY